MPHVEARRRRGHLVSRRPGASGRGAGRASCAASMSVPDATPRAIVAPHAGLMYSGPVARSPTARHAVRDPRRSCSWGRPTLFPSTGVSIWPDGAWETPLGPIQVDEDLASADQEASDAIVEIAVGARARTLARDAAAVSRASAAGRADCPDGDGTPDAATSFALGDAIARAVACDRAGTCCSSPAAISRTTRTRSVAARLDGVVLERVAAMDAHGLMAHSSASRVTPAAVVRWWQCSTPRTRLGASGARVLSYADSGDVSGDKSSVVGYMAAAIW